MGDLGILLSLLKKVKVKRFNSKNPEAVWVRYQGPADARVLIKMIEGTLGLDFDFNVNERGFIVLPGPVCVQVTYHSGADMKDEGFTQILQFTATAGKDYSLEIDEENRIMLVASV